MSWQPIETAPKDGTQFLAVREYMSHNYDEDGSIHIEKCRDRVIAQFILYTFSSLPAYAAISGEVLTHWKPLDPLP